MSYATTDFIDWAIEESDRILTEDGFFPSAEDQKFADNWNEAEVDWDDLDAEEHCRESC